MQNERDAANKSRDPFNMFGGLGNFGGFGNSIFGRNVFDDRFFTHPFSSMSTQGDFGNDKPHIHNSKGPLIQELNSDDEGERIVNEGDQVQRSSTTNQEPFVTYPDDESPENNKRGHVNHTADCDSVEGTKAQTFKFHTCRVTYGGVDGAYYTSQATRRIGSNGVMMEDCKEADSRTGQSMHKISRGIHDKGLSLTRKLNSDGKVDTLQTLHNLHEDELATFEEAWKGNYEKHLLGQHNSFGFNRGTGGSDQMLGRERLLLPSSGVGQNSGPQAANSSGVRAKQVVRINIE